VSLKELKVRSPNGCSHQRRQSFNCQNRNFSLSWDTTGRSHK